MKQLAIAAATGMMLFAGQASAANYEEIAAQVDTGAFADAGERWRRQISNRHAECGNINRTSVQRVDVLIDRYNSLAEAVANNDESAAMEAAAALSSRIESNQFYKKCWKAMAKRAKLSRDFSETLSEI